MSECDDRRMAGSMENRSVDNGAFDTPRQGSGSDNLSNSLSNHGPWRIRSSAIKYCDPWLSVRRDEVIRPDGTDGTYATVAIKPGVCVVAIDDDGQVHLTDEFHYAVGRDTIEGVSGGIESGDTALETAHRELAEELGIAATHLIAIGVTDPFTASVQSPTALFIATGLTLGDANPESTELIRHVTMPIALAVDAVKNGQITHAPTCIILLRMALDQASHGA